MKAKADEVSFFVKGKPQPKQRARASKRRFYTPKETKDAEEIVRLAALRAMAGKPPLEGAIEIEITFTFPNTRKRGKSHFTRPDLDNLVKLVKDGMSKIVYKDDSQVCRLTADKSHTKAGEEGTLVHAWKRKDT